MTGTCSLISSSNKSFVPSSEISRWVDSNHQPRNFKFPCSAVGIHRVKATSLNIPLLLDPRFFVPMGWLALGVWPYCQTSLFPSCNCTFWTWKGFPVGFKPTRQVSSSASLHGRSRTSGGCATWHSHRGSASIYFAMGNWKVVLKGNLSWSGQHGSITPLLFLIPETWTCLFSRGHMGCSEPIAGYLPRLSLVVLLNTTEHFALPLIQIEVDVSESHVPNGI